MEVTSKAKESESDYKLDRFNWLLVVVGNSDVGAGGAAATPDKERKLVTRNQIVMNKEIFTIMMPK